MKRDGGNVVAVASDVWDGLCPDGAVLFSSSKSVLWKVNEFIVESSSTNKPAVVTWYGAMAFCRFYGYDLPTEAEWERAARGIDHSAMGTHLLYPWESDSSAYIMANTNESGALKDVGSYETAFDAPYRLCDMIGNAGEWTRSVWTDSFAGHAGREALTNIENNVNSSWNIVLRGVGSYQIFKRFACQKDSLSYQYGVYGTLSQPKISQCGFRVCLRPNTVDEGYDSGGGESSSGSVATRVSTGVLTFEDWSTRASNKFGYIASNGYSWGLGFAWECMQTSEFAHSGKKCIYSYNGGSGTGTGAFSEFILPTAPGSYKIVEIRMYAGNYGDSERSLSIETSIDGKSYASVTKKVPPGGYTQLVYTPKLIGRYGRINYSGGIYLDDIEVIYDIK